MERGVADLEGDLGTERSGGSRERGSEGTYLKVGARLGHDFELLEELVVVQEPSKVFLRSRETSLRKRRKQGGKDILVELVGVKRLANLLVVREDLLPRRGEVVIVLREGDGVELGEPFEVAKRDGVERFDLLGNRSAVDNRQVTVARAVEERGRTRRILGEGLARIDQSAPRSDSRWCS